MRRYAPKIRTVFLILNLVILLLPLLGIQALRLYESELIRQTESALISQGVYIREHFKAELLLLIRAKAKNKAATQDGILRYGTPIEAKFLPPPFDPHDQYQPIQAELEMTRERIRPRAENAVYTPALADPLAARVGEAVSPILRRTQRYALSGVRIVDYRGTVVATTSGELGLSIINREEVARALRGETISILRERVSDQLTPEITGISRGGLVRVFLGLPITYDGRVLGAVVLSRTPMDIQKALFLNRFVLLRYFSGLILIVLAVSLLTAVTVSRPLGALIEQTRRVKANVATATEPIAHPGSYEIRELSHAIADMAKTLSERANYIQTFAQNVSHEFKTPIAAIQAIVELFRDHMGTMSLAERTRFLDMLTADATRMQKLVERLLVLARADVAEPVEDQTNVGAALVLLTRRFRETGLDVTVLPDHSGHDLNVRMTQETFESLVTNLLENARQHGSSGVKVQISARALDNNAVEVTVADDGPGISAANQSRIFTPFFTTARETGGTGLGLSIVRSLVEAHGGTIAVTSPRPNMNRGVDVTFTCALPKPC